MKYLIKIILLSILVFGFYGCLKPLPKNNKGIDSKLDLTLDKPRDIKTLSDITSIAFEWKRIKDTRVAGIYVYRTDNNKNNLRRIKTIKSRYATHFVDSKLKPNTNYTYKFSTYSDEDLESAPSNAILAKTRDILGPITFIEALNNLPQSTKIIFKPHSNARVGAYEIQRRSPVDPEWKTIDKVDGRLTAEYIDTELKDGKVYEYRVFGVTYDDIKTHPSKVVLAKTRKLPVMVKKITATTDKPKYIGIKWKYNTKDLNITFNIYRADKVRGPYKIVKKNWGDTAIKDEVGNDEEIFFYKITAVDEYGLESLQPSIGTKGNTLARPKPPHITYSAIEDGTGHIKWDVDDDRSDTFVILRKVRVGLFSSKDERTEHMTKKEFLDPGLEIDSKTTYSVIAIDENGIESEPSQSVTLSYSKDKK